MTQTLAAVDTTDLVAPLRTGATWRTRPAGPVPAVPGLHHLADLGAAAAGLVALAVAGSAPGLLAAVTLLLGWPALLACTGAHRLREVAGTAHHRARRVLQTGAVVGLGCWAVDALVVLPVDQQLLVLLVVTLTALSALGCLLQEGARRSCARLLVVGHDREVSGVLAELDALGGRRFDPVALCLLDSRPQRPFGLPTTHDLGSVPEVADVHHADAVLVLPSPLVSSRDLQRLGWSLEGTGAHLYVGTGLLDVDPGRAVLARVGGLRLLHLRTHPGRGAARVVKAVLERLAAGLALFLLGPVLLAVAVAVRLDSSGPALFAQERVGRDGRRFTMLKFRTMRVAADTEVTRLAARNEGAGVLFKIRRDPRITRVGGFLRRYSLDELPQLINVVRGDMALVGPRPALPREVAEYDHDPRRRLVVKPGLTGLWQVSGRSDLSWEESVRLDLAYVDNWSLTLDLRIVLRTFGAVLGHRGAY